MSTSPSTLHVTKESRRLDPPPRFRASRSFRPLFGVIVFLMLYLSGTVLTDWSQVPVAQAATRPNPNPPLSAPAWLQSPTPVPHQLAPATTRISPYHASYPHAPAKVAVPSVLTLTPQAQQVLTKDGHLQVTIPAGTVTSAQVKAAGGTIHLTIKQTDPGAGGGAGGRVFLGTYQLLLQDAHNQPLTTLALAHPLTLTYRLQPAQSTLVLNGQAISAIWQALTPAGSTATGNTKASPASSQPATHVQLATRASKGLDWSVSTTLSGQTAATSKTASPNATTTPAVALAASSVTFNTQTPQASWGIPQNVDVGLSSGGLEYSYPLHLPPGPGGSTPPLTLSYSSGSVNESHNVQAATTWVGEGWNLGLGSITWSQENVTPGGTNREENVWHITDPNGISGQLIPPDMNVSTSAPQVPSSIPAQFIWHTAPESHARVQEVSFNGSPCWHVWLPDGTLEEFGCTNDARESAQDASGNFNPYAWNLNLIVDRNGNQIRINYQRDFPSGATAVRDAVISSIEYDDPSCHQTSFNGATAECSTWNPKIRIVFDASNKVNTLTGGNCGSWSDGTYRCDDPQDLSGSGGLGISKVLNKYVLNDIQVQVQGHLLHKYLFSYEQTQPQTITDPATGAQESVAGYLDLTQIQEQGTNGTTLNAPVTNLSYTTQTQRYVDLAFNAAAAAGCPSWTTSNSGGCVLWEQSYNGRYLSTIDNGQGWHENVSWNEAHGNTHGDFQQWAEATHKRQLTDGGAKRGNQQRGKVIIRKLLFIVFGEQPHAYG